jgi:hypothetical protein
VILYNFSANNVYETNDTNVSRETIETIEPIEPPEYIGRNCEAISIELPEEIIEDKEDNEPLPF